MKGMIKKMMSEKRLVIIINGKGGVGKDTLVNALNPWFVVRNVSSITPIKHIAKENGWDGEKDDKSRKFLADLKQTFIDYNDLPTTYLINEYYNFLNSKLPPDQILVAHIREGSEIEKFKSSINLPCVTILIQRQIIDEKTFGNSHDNDVDNYNYDIIFDNNDSEEASKEKFVDLIMKIYAERAVDPFKKD